MISEIAKWDRMVLAILCWKVAAKEIIWGDGWIEPSPGSSVVQLWLDWQINIEFSASQVPSLFSALDYVLWRLGMSDLVSRISVVFRGYRRKAKHFMLISLMPTLDLWNRSTSHTKLNTRPKARASSPQLFLPSWLYSSAPSSNKCLNGG